jgi:ferrochelatase
MSPAGAARPANAILLMAYGTPGRPEDIAAYYTHIRGGRAPGPEQVAALAARYQAIGGSSPLLEITRAVAEGLRAATGVPVYVGMKHWHPYIEAAVEQMRADGVTGGAGIVLAPHYSRMSVGAYIKTASGAAERLGGPRLRFVESWHRHPGLIAALAARVRAAVARLGAPDGHVLFTAHSLPKRIVDWQDPYPAQLVETSTAVADAAGISRWSFAFQSASATGEPWLGPDVLDALRDLQSKHIRDVVVCPVGFVADHLEVLYDLDVEARGLAGSLGMRLVRTESLNAAPDFIAVLAAIARDVLDAAPPSSA